MAAQFERLAESFRQLRDQLPLPVRIFLSMIGPYGLKLPRRR